MLYLNINTNNTNNNTKRVNRLKESGYIQNFEPLLNQSSRLHSTSSSSGHMVVAAAAAAATTPLQTSHHLNANATSAAAAAVPNHLTINESSSLSSTSSSPRTRIKLKNLQEALIKEYSNEHVVNQFHINNNDRKSELYTNNNYASSINRKDSVGFVKKEKEPILYPGRISFFFHSFNF